MYWVVDLRGVEPHAFPFCLNSVATSFRLIWVCRLTYCVAPRRWEIKPTSTSNTHNETHFAGLSRRPAGYQFHALPATRPTQRWLGDKRLTRLRLSLVVGSFRITERILSFFTLPLRVQEVRRCVDLPDPSPAGPLLRPSFLVGSALNACLSTPPLTHYEK